MKKILALFIVIFLSFLTNLGAEQNIDNVKIIRFEQKNDYSEINLFFRLTDDFGNPVFNVNKDNIALKLNTLNQDFQIDKIQDTKAGTEAAANVSAVFVLDASGSINQTTRNEITGAVKSFIGKMKQGDKAGIFLFNNYVFRLQELTGDKQKLINSLTRFQSGGTLSKINNAINDALNYVNAFAKNSKKVVIVISDGLDEGSNVTSEQVINLAKKYKIPVYSMGYTNINPKFFGHLENISGKTGGEFSLKDSKNFAEKILAIEKSVLKISFSPKGLEKQNKIELTFLPSKKTAVYNFTIPEEIFQKITREKAKNIQIIIIGSILLAIILILIIILVIRSKRKKKTFSKEQANAISRLINEDVLETTSELKNVYFKAISERGLNNENFTAFSKRLKALLEKAKSNLKSTETKKAFLYDTIIEKLNNLEKMGLTYYSTTSYFVEPYKSQIIYAIEGRIAQISDYEKTAFSKILLRDLEQRIEQAGEFPLTLKDIDKYRSIITKSTYSEGDIQNFISYIMRSKNLVDDEERSNAEMGIKTLEKLVSNNGRRNYKLGIIVCEPYLSEIKEKIKLAEQKLNTLSPEEKKAITTLAIKDMREHNENVSLYEDIIKSTNIDKNLVESLYKKLSSELMYCEIEDEERSIDCSALYKISMSKNCDNKECTKEDIFGEQGSKKIKKVLNEIKNKKLDPETENRLDELMNSFSLFSDNLTQKYKDIFYDTGTEIEIDSIVENFLFKSFAAGQEGFDLNRILQELSSYDSETLAKLMPYMIQVVKDSQGTEKEANLGILKNLAANLNIDFSDLSDVSAWEDWWKRNKTKVMKDISKLEEKEKRKTNILGFSLHEDVVFYKLHNNTVQEIHGKVIEIKGSELTLLIYDLINLEEIIAVYARQEAENVYLSSTYAFLRTMWISEIEENIYESGLVFLKHEEGAEARELEDRLAGE